MYQYINKLLNNLVSLQDFYFVCEQNNFFNTYSK